MDDIEETSALRELVALQSKQITALKSDLSMVQEFLSKALDELSEIEHSNKSAKELI